jgi:hypothetical protein
MTASEIDGFNDLLSDAEDGAKSDWEHDFIASMKARYARWEGQMFISPKQLATLEKLCAKG